MNVFVLRTAPAVAAEGMEGVVLGILVVVTGSNNIISSATAIGWRRAGVGKRNVYVTPSAAAAKRLTDDAATGRSA